MEEEAEKVCKIVVKKELGKLVVVYEISGQKN